MWRLFFCPPVPNGTFGRGPDYCCAKHNVMKKLRHFIVSRLAAFTPVALAAPILAGVFSIPLLKLPTIPASAPVNQNALQLNEPAPSDALVAAFFGAATPTTISGPIIQSAMNYVSSRSAFPASLAVIQKHEALIRQSAAKYGVPADVAIGVGLLENGGSETAKSPAGALGVFQLMPSTARSLGLTVTKKIDERADPAKNIDAGVRYLALNYYRFGDWGLSTWAYHAGEGNVAKAVQLYAKAMSGVALPGVTDPTAIRDYVSSHGVSVNKLLSNAAVQGFTKKLADDSAGYPYKVVATATLFNQAKTNATVSNRPVADLAR